MFQSLLRFLFFLPNKIWKMYITVMGRGDAFTSRLLCVSKTKQIVRFKV